MRPFMTALIVPFAGLLVALPLILLLGARLLNMASLPIWDPSEARYAVLSANMAESGDFIRPTFWHHNVRQTFLGKPPMAFQMGGVACKLFGRTPFAVRLPAFLSACGVLLLLWWASGSWKASLLCVTMGGFYVLSGVCMTDMPLTFGICGMLATFWRYRAQPRCGTALAFGGFAAFGFLVKGPVALVLGGAPILLWLFLKRRESLGIRPAHLVLALGVFLALVVPWLVSIEVQEPGALRYFFINENLGRFVTQEYGDRYGSGHAFFYGVSVPWVLLLSLPWGIALFRKQTWQGVADCFPACAALTMVGFWCLTPRVPLAYLLPAVPMVAWWLSKQPSRLFRSWAPVAGAYAIIIVLAIGILPKLNPGKFPSRIYRAIPQERTVSFVGSSPYSAEFYLGKRLRHDGSGDVLLHKTNSRYEFLPKPIPQPRHPSPRP